MKKITIILLVITVLNNLFFSCKKDEETVKAAGSASAELTLGTIASGNWTANTAVAVKTGNNYVVTAKGSNNAILIITLVNITTTGTFTTGVTQSFTYNNKTYLTTNNGGGNVIITGISASAIEGTFLFEGFDGMAAGASYCGMYKGKFTASL